eukprot:353108-Chlamydomonas_euryale.AAC.3
MPSGVTINGGFGCTPGSIGPVNCTQVVHATQVPQPIQMADIFMLVKTQLNMARTHGRMVRQWRHNGIIMVITSPSTDKLALGALQAICQLGRPPEQTTTQLRRDIAQPQ